MADMNESMEQAAKKAGNYYDGNYHCCEAVVLSVCEYMGENSEVLLRISMPFGGGMASNGAACGALVAAYLCLGYFKGKSTPEGGRSVVTVPADRIFQKFREKFGSPNCRDITGFDKKDPKAAAEHGSRVKRDICIPLVRDVTRWILEELEQVN